MRLLLSYLFGLISLLLYLGAICVFVGTIYTGLTNNGYQYFPRQVAIFFTFLISAFVLSLIAIVAHPSKTS